MAPAGSADRQRPRLLRILVLLLLLLAAAIHYSSTLTRRLRRNEWTGTLRIAVPILRDHQVPDAVVGELFAGLPELEARFAEELRRVRPEAPRPFEFVPVGPLDVATPPPPPPAGPGFGERASFAWRQHAYLAPLEEELGLDRSAFDATIYVYVEPPGGPASLRFVEGAGALDGELGIVHGALDLGMVEQALIAVGHELLHCLGATDKYDGDGHALEPDGLAEPELRPRHPQRFAEIMVGELPLGPGQGRLASGLAEVRVGPVTAREIGWTRE